MRFPCGGVAPCASNSVRTEMRPAVVHIVELRSWGSWMPHHTCVCTVPYYAGTYYVNGRVKTQWSPSMCSNTTWLRDAAQHRIMYGSKRHRRPPSWLRQATVLTPLLPGSLSFQASKLPSSHSRRPPVVVVLGVIHQAPQQLGFFLVISNVFLTSTCALFSSSHSPFQEYDHDSIVCSPHSFSILRFYCLVRFRLFEVQGAPRHPHWRRHPLKDLSWVFFLCYRPLSISQVALDLVVLLYLVCKSLRQHSPVFA